MTSLVLIFWILLSGFMVFSIIRIVLAKRVKRFEILKNYKRGMAAVFYLLMFPIFYIGIYAGCHNVLESICKGIQMSVELIVLKVDYSKIIYFMSENNVYKYAIYSCYLLATINTLLITFALFGRVIVNRIKNMRIMCKKKIYLIIGTNENCCNIARSSKQAVILGELSSDERDQLYVKGFVYRRFNNNDNIAKILNGIKAINKKSINIIVNTGNDEANIVLAKQVLDYVNEKNITNYQINEDIGFNCFVFGEPECEKSYMNFVEKGKGCIRYINKYKIIAFDFEERYPMTQFMTDREIDYDRAEIRKEIKLNVVLLGFRNTNKQIFTSSIANNQFLDVNNEHKQVHYYIFDNIAHIKDKTMNHEFFRFQNENRQGDYYDLPAPPAIVECMEMSVDDEKFYPTLKKRITTEKPYSYIIIDHGKDLENVDLAYKVAIKLKEWDVDKFTKIFVKIRNNSLSDNIISKEFGDMFIPFANEEEVVYNLDEIINEKSAKIAMRRHLSYVIKRTMDEQSLNGDKLDSAIKILQDEKNNDYIDILKKAKESFSSMNSIKREANIYAYLNTRSKLHLMGFDYVLNSSDEKDAYDDFLAKYTYGDPIVYDTKESQNGKKEIVYKISDFDRDSIRQHLAVQEHLRWNAYEICRGCVPASKQDMVKYDKKGLEERRKHPNIASFKGLIEYREDIAKRDNIPLIQADVIKYDYEVLDDAKWFIYTCGYKIVKKGGIENGKL